MSRRLDIFNNRNVLACHQSFGLKAVRISMLTIGDVSMRKSMLAVASHADAVSRRASSLSEAHAISALAALAQPTRLAIFRLLIKHEPIGITAGVIAGNDWRAAQYPLDASRHSGAGRPAAQFARGPHDHLPLGRRRHAVGDRVPGQRMLRRASGALQPGRGRRRGVLRAGAGESRAQREESRRQAEGLIATGHDLDAVGIGGSDGRGISRRACRRRRCA